MKFSLTRLLAGGAYAARTSVSRDGSGRNGLSPSSDTTKGYEKFAGMMPATFGQMLTAAQLEALVTFLANKK